MWCFFFLLLEFDDGDSFTTEFESFGMEGTHLFGGLQLLADELFQDSVTFAMQDANLVFGEKHRGVDEAA